MSICVASDVHQTVRPARRPSVRVLFPEQISETCGWIYLILHTHIPYVVYMCLLEFLKFHLHNWATISHNYL